MTYENNNGKHGFLLVIIQLIIAIGTVAGGVWIAATWTAGQESKIGRLDYRVEQLEKSAIGSAPQEGKLGRIEYRVDQLEKANQEDRSLRHQYEQEVKVILNDITTRLTNMQILWAKTPMGRH